MIDVADPTAAIRDGSPGGEPPAVRRLRGRALVVADAASAQTLRPPLESVELDSVRVADAYAAMVELVRRPLAFRAVVLSLAGLYPEEMELIEAVKRRFGHVEVVLAHSEGREAALAEGVRLGADGLIVGDRIHRIAGRASGSQAADAAEGTGVAAVAGGGAPAPGAVPGFGTFEPQGADEPVLTPEELHALLQEDE